MTTPGRLATTAMALLVATGCLAEPGADDLEPVDDPVLDGKDDAATRRVVVQGPARFGGELASEWDDRKLHGWTFHAAAGARVDLTLAGDPDAGTDPVLLLYGPRSGDGWSGRPIARDDDGGGGTAARLGGVELPATGEYLAIAACKNRGFRGRTYRLGLACADDTCGLAVEVDFVGYQRLEAGTVDLLRDTFASIGYPVVLAESDELEPVEILDYGSQSAMLRDLYRAHFDHRGQPGWHYLLVGDAVANGNRGWAPIGGDILLVSSDPVSAHPDHRAEAQANIILHELGHNLGLLHQGFEPELGAGTHGKSTCATADAAPAPPVPITAYSPTCVEHLRLESTPFVID